MSWIQTYSGKRFELLNPEPAMICIEDIAHALSLQCRFSGHTRGFYSVAQHSVIVSENCQPGWELEGLMHDAAEAYIGDITSPFKAQLPRVAEVETRILQAICERFGMQHLELWPGSIWLADRSVLAGEARDLLSHHLDWEKDLPLAVLRKIEPVMPEIAERMFLRRFEFYRKA